MGSGVCGVIAARDALGLRTRIVAVVSAGAPAFALSFERGEPISHDVTTQLADGMACRTPDNSALTIARRGVERVIQVTEDEVGAAMRAFFTDTHNVAEGAGAAALAALVKERESMRGRIVAVVLTGANVDSNVFAGIIS
jgi:threonine dehydratase